MLFGRNLTAPAYLRHIDTQTPGRRYDVTPLFADYVSFAALVRDLAEPFRDVNLDLVAGIDALGFILGAALALDLGTGFLPIRKRGKLPVPTDTVECVDYSGERKALEVRQDALQPGVRVLVVDEWIETGAQVSAAIELIERRGGVVAGIATINMDENARTRSLRSRYICHWLWREDSDSAHRRACDLRSPAGEREDSDSAHRE